MKGCIFLLTSTLLTGVLGTAALADDPGYKLPLAVEEACADYSGASSGPVYSCCMSTIKQSCSRFLFLTSYCRKIPFSMATMDCNEALEAAWKNQCKPEVDRGCGRDR